LRGSEERQEVSALVFVGVYHTVTDVSPGQTGRADGDLDVLFDRRTLVGIDPEPE
jgi:hypothetical protein